MRPEVRLPDIIARGQFGGRAVHQDLADFQHIGAMSHLQRHAGVLFDQQDSEFGFLVQLADDRENLLDDSRC